MAKKKKKTLQPTARTFYWQLKFFSPKIDVSIKHKYFWNVKLRNSTVKGNAATVTELNGFIFSVNKELNCKQTNLYCKFSEQTTQDKNKCSTWQYKQNVLLCK